MYFHNRILISSVTRDQPKSKRFRCQVSGQNNWTSLSLNSDFSSQLALQTIKFVGLLMLLFMKSFQLNAQTLPADTVQFDNAAPEVEQYLQKASQNNPELKSAFNQYLAALEEVPQVGALPDPQVAFSYFIAPIETRVGPQQARLSVSQMFPWFGTLGTQQAVKVQKAKAEFQKFQNKRNMLFHDIKSTWYELYVLEKKISILEENIDLLEILEELSLQKYETAEGNQADVLQVQIELEDLNIKRSELADNRTVIQQEFTELTNAKNIHFPDSIAVSARELPAAPVELKQQMINQNPSLSQLAFEAKASKKSVQAAKLNGLPTFGLGADYVFTGQRQGMQITNNGQNAFMARASIQLPLWRGKYRAQKKQAQLTQQAVRERQVSQKNQLLTQFEKAMRNFRSAQRRINLYDQKQIDRTRQAINVLTEQYSTAATDFEEILRLQRRLLNYQQAREEAIGNQNKAVARIEFLTGHYNLNPEISTN